MIKNPENALNGTDADLYVPAGNIYGSIGQGI